MASPLASEASNHWLIGCKATVTITLLCILQDIKGLTGRRGAFYVILGMKNNINNSTLNARCFL